MKKKIVILYGGEDESEISYKSALNVFAACHELKYHTSLIKVGGEDLQKLLSLCQDSIILNLVHGRWGEDGSAQALFEFLGISYFGSSSRSCELTFDKLLFRNKMFDLIPMPNGRAYCKDEYIHSGPSHPHVIKPHDSGSTIGVHYVDSPESKAYALQEWHDGERIVEEFVDGPEGAVSVYNGEIIGGVMVNFAGAIFDYDAKYNPGLSKLESWDTLSQLLRDEISKYCKIIYSECNCEGGLLCVDFRLSKDGNVYILEANSIPGMTECSLIPYCFERKGVSFKDIVQLMINDSTVKQTSVKKKAVFG